MANGAHELINFCIRKLADALERAFEIFFFSQELRFVGQVAPRAAAADVYVRARRLGAQVRGLNEAFYAGARE